MMRAILAVIGVLIVGAGCASAPGKKKAMSAEPLAAGVEVDNSEAISRFSAGVDSAVALFDFGDMPDFLTLRNELRAKMESMANANPSIRSEPEFERILKSLADLDSLQIVQSYSELDETDKHALSVQEWPEVDASQSPRRTGRRPRDKKKEDDSVFPRIDNERVDFWIRYFTGPGQERFARALYRMELYRPIVERVLREQDLPQELMCVALIESGYHLKARSSARAVGPWQFIRGTARIYGLRVDWWFDERRDIVASTYAATNYLKDLYGIWQSWPLALAAYNCGEYRVARAVARHKTTDFWQLELPKQTERYVPKFLAALYIVREPEKYGFTIPDVEPVKFDEVELKDATDLKLIAQCAGTTVDVLADLNPYLLRWATPPKTTVNVKVPAGTGRACKEKLEAIPPDERVTWRKHRIGKGETLSVIAGRYATSISALMKLNGIRNAHRIREGHYLIVPIQGAFSEVASTEPAYKSTRRNIDKETLEKYAKRFEPPADHKRVTYVVKDNDTLGEIAEVFRTSARRIRNWNNLRYRSYIYPGQKLVIYVPQSFDVSKAESRTRRPEQPDSDEYVLTSYTVKEGDTIYGISKKFNVKMVDVLAWNDKSSRSKIYPGQKLDIWQKKNP